MSGFTPAALAYLADITEEYAGDRGAIMGLYSVFLGVGQFVGSSLGGPFADWRGMDGVILLSALARSSCCRHYLLSAPRRKRVVTSPHAQPSL